MSKQFLNVPVENAKELIERFITAPGISLPAYTGATVAYVEEVIFNNSFLVDLLAGDTVYFGTMHLLDPASGGSFDFDNGTDAAIEMAKFGAGLLASGSLDCLIFNKIGSVTPDNAYFYGYKFTITRA